MAITATAGTQAATVTPARPSWADMEKHYPAAAIGIVQLYDTMIGGDLKGLHKLPAYENTCAIRMSYGLNRSGLKLGKAPSKGGSLKGADDYLYWIRVSDLKPHLMTRFSGADEKLTLPAIPAALVNDSAALSTKFKERVALAQAWLDKELAGRKGIVVFDVSGWGNASGHFTLWDGVKKQLAYASGHDDSTTSQYYFWLTSLGQKKDGTKFLIQVVEVKFWELK